MSLVEFSNFFSDPDLRSYYLTIAIKKIQFQVGEFNSKSTKYEDQ